MSGGGIAEVGKIMNMQVAEPVRPSAFRYGIYTPKLNLFRNLCQGKPFRRKSSSLSPVQIQRPNGTIISRHYFPTAANELKSK